jgi:hypothetical protein
MTYKNTNRRDANEAEMIELWKRAGVICIQRTLNLGEIVTVKYLEKA